MTPEAPSCVMPENSPLKIGVARSVIPIRGRAAQQMNPAICLRRHAHFRSWAGRSIHGLPLR
jgi:hypothetical protein